jgi:LmbE family N-acetylglucosaminyl deacetylase
VAEPYLATKESRSVGDNSAPTRLGQWRFGQLSRARWYWCLSLLVLLAVAVYSAILGAHVEQGNADQLSDSYLFQNGSTLRGATFPGQHTQLLKWPLFYLVKMFGYSETAFVGLTVVCVVLTVAFLAYVLHRIERRPQVTGTLYLALASVLLLVPIQSYPGALLPVSLAMLTTRNIEYVVYILALGLLAKRPRFRSWRFCVAIALLAILIASDKLFLSLSIGGAVLALLYYALAKFWPLVSMSVDWLVAGGLAAVASAVILKLVSATHLTHIANQAGANPYGLVTSAKNFVLGCIYAVSSLFTNFGANPAYDARTLRQIPDRFVHHLFSIGGFSFLINIIILLVGLLAVYRLLRATISTQAETIRTSLTSFHLSFLLLWTTAASVVVFVLTNHDYAVDARYLGISLFAVFVTAACYGRSRDWSSSQLRRAGIILSISIFLGLFAAQANYHSDQKALASYNSRDQKISDVLASHPIQTLVGDYWRTLPIKYQVGASLTVTPLDGCTQPRLALSSQAWQPNLYTTRFAYLLTLDGSLTGYPSCSLNQVISAYGRPNSSALIAGTLANPQELLLFYDNGAHRSQPKTTLTATPATVLPISLSDLPYTSCQSPTIMNIVAHQDDDLLFMSPDLLHEIKAGDCVRTVYMTAGDAGSSSVYWLSREHGSEAAYAEMDDTTNIWVQRIVELNNHEFVMVANPRGNSKISLVFMHLPDGNLKGQGFAATHFESLAKLDAGTVKSMQSVDGQSSYSAQDLTNALISLMYAYQPTEIQTQSNLISTVYPDHSDHMAVGRFVQKAYHQYEKEQYNNVVTIPLKFYTGYPSHQFAPNVSGADLAAKEAAFLDYAAYDGGVCHTVTQCLQTPTYGSYLTRQYQEPY